METEQEAEGYKERLAEIKQQTNEITEQFQEPKFPTDQEKQDIDSRSVYVGNVDYGSTPLQVQQHFSSAGVVNRVTILKDKFTGQPRGFAYVEFEDPAAVHQAVAMLDGSTFNDRELKVSAKRTNIPGVTTTSRGGRGRGRGRGAFRGRGRGRGGFRGGFRGRGGFAPY